MRAEGDAWIASFVLLAAAAVMAAPILGRAGAPGWANASMLLAAGSGVAAFGIAGLATLRAARRDGRGADPADGGCSDGKASDLSARAGRPGPRADVRRVGLQAGPVDPGALRTTRKADSW